MGIFAGTAWDRPPTCERCGKLEAECACLPLPKEWKPPQEQTARIALEKRKKGKLVTVVSGLNAADCDLADLLTQLKTACGAGGTTKDDCMEIQGSHVQRVRELLTAIGFRIGN